MQRLMVVILGVAFAIGFAVGCGSGEDEAESAPLTKAQFVKQAEAICAEGLKEREKELASLEKEGSAEGKQGEAFLKLVGERVAPSVQREAEELQALAPPAKDEAEITPMIDAISQASEDLENGKSQKALRDMTELQREMADYGVRGCP